MERDSAFPLQKNLMKPYPESNKLSTQQKHYNYCQACARRVIENAFGRLKARFRIVAKRNEYQITKVSKIIQACCILHNLCEESGDFPEPHWLIAAAYENEVHETTIGNNNVQAKQVRETLSNYFYTNRSV